MERVLIQVMGKGGGWTGIGLPVESVKVDVALVWDSDIINKGMIGADAEGNFAYLFFVGIVGRGGRYQSKGIYSISNL